MLESLSKEEGTKTFNRQLFYTKPPVKVSFNTPQTNDYKKRKINDDSYLTNQHQNSHENQSFSNTVLPDNVVKYDKCVFHHCVFNVST